MTEKEAEMRFSILRDRQANACAVWTALHDVGAPAMDTRWKWAEREIRDTSRELNALKTVMQLGKVE